MAQCFQKAAQTSTSIQPGDDAFRGHTVVVVCPNATCLSLPRCEDDPVDSRSRRKSIPVREEPKELLLLIAHE